MTTINYTRVASPDSQAVDRAWYNDNNHDLYLELHGVVYRYDNVPVHVYDELLDADSVGRYYRTRVQQYGPALHLGAKSNLTTIWETPRTQPVAAVEPVRVSGASFKPLTKTFVDKTFATGTTATQHLSLNKDVTKAIETTYDHKFVFTIDGFEGERTHTLKAKTWDDAIESMIDLAENGFGRTITLKSVTVLFD